MTVAGVGVLFLKNRVADRLLRAGMDTGHAAETIGVIINSPAAFNTDTPLRTHTGTDAAADAFVRHFVSGLFYRGTVVNGIRDIAFIEVNFFFRSRLDVILSFPEIRFDQGKMLIHFFLRIQFSLFFDIKNRQRVIEHLNCIEVIDMLSFFFKEFRIAGSASAMVHSVSHDDIEIFCFKL